ncbi:hypothetical protein [Streptodolium elevatio]|uniref:Uncharacterized protein n=1 Tax=Streptodolium elevatio TaxID=3157996 RepID=A0ABV3D9M0_9ACTN
MSAAQQIHVMLAPAGKDPITPKKTELPKEMNSALGTVAGFVVALLVVYALFMLFRALADAIGAYRDGSAVPFAGIIVILVCLALATGGISFIVFAVA